MPTILCMKRSVQKDTYFWIKADPNFNLINIKLNPRNIFNF
jgi:hypothetical protein